MIARMLLAAVIALPAVVTAAPAARAQGPEADAAYQAALASAQLTEPVFGPETAALQANNTVDALLGIDVALADVVIQVEGIAPLADPGETWGLLIAFRDGDDNHSVLVWSDGAWSFVAHGADEPVTGQSAVNWAPGDPFDIDLVAIGDTGYLAVDDTVVTTLDLSSYTGPGGISLIAALAGGDYDSGNSPVLISNVTIWEAPVATGATQATAGQQESATDNAGIYGTVMAAAAQTEPDIGPISGQLTHESGGIDLSTAGVELADFVAHMECLPPGPGEGGTWDCGLLFRATAGQGNQYRFGVRSDGTWFHSQDAGQTLQSGEGLVFPPMPGGSVTIDLIAYGETGYVGVDGRFLTTLDLSALTTPGDVAVVVNFYATSVSPGAATGIEDFAVWSLATGSPLDNAIAAATQPEVSDDRGSRPGAATTATEPVPAATEVAGSASSYTSPTYGYALEWNDTWSVVEETSDARGDYLGLTNGVVFVDLIGASFDPAQGSCFAQIVTFYEQDPAYSNVEPQQDEQSVAPGVWDETGVIALVVTEGTGEPLLNYVGCSVLPGQNAAVSLEMLVPISEFAANLDAMWTLLLGFVAQP